MAQQYAIATYLFIFNFKSQDTFQKHEWTCPAKVDWIYLVDNLGYNHIPSNISRLVPMKALLINCNFKLRKKKKYWKVPDWNVIHFIDKIALSTDYTCMFDNNRTDK